MNLESLKKDFEKRYGTGSEIYTFFSPGRVNLIGEHTDYNGGYVFPCALSFGTYAAVRKREDDLLKLASTSFDLAVEVSFKDLEYKKEHGWTNYLKGIAVQFQNRGFEFSGLEILISGNIPNSAGLSSSASIELLMSVILNDLFNCGLSMLEMVKLSQKSENEYIGLNCGIMDQFAVGMGKQNMAMFLDCMNLNYEYIPVELKDCELIIANTNKPRGLADSKYNERRSQCEEAVKQLNQKLSINFLGDLTIEQFEEHKSLIKDKTILNRAEHIVYENNRVKEACEKLKAGDIETFGKLMNESHASLKDLYEVTGIELDTLAEEALKLPGVIGSRMTGAGFGGCTVSIVKKDSVNAFIEQLAKIYKDKTGLTADFYTPTIGGGAGRL